MSVQVSTTSTVEWQYEGRVVEFRHHLAAMKYCSQEKELDEVAACIKKTVPRSHPEYAPLVAAGRARREEIRKELENATKANN